MLETLELHFLQLQESTGVHVGIRKMQMLRPCCLAAYPCRREKHCALDLKLPSS